MIGARPLALLLAAAAGLFAQPASERLVQCWKDLDARERRLVHERFSQIRALDEVERALLTERFEVLRDVEERLLEELRESDPDLAAAVQSAGEIERRRLLRPRLVAWIDEQAERIQAPVASEPLFLDGEKVAVPKLREAVHLRAAETLYRLERLGLLGEGESDRLLSLPPFALKRALDEIAKRHLSRSLPGPIGRLPPQARKRLLALPGPRLMREWRQLRGRRPDPGQAIRRLLGPRGGVKPLWLIPRPGRPPAIPWQPRKEDIERALSPEQREALRGLPSGERRRKTHEFLRENARAALEARGESASALEGLDRLPPAARLPFLLRLIDPDAGPPARQRGERPGPPKAGDRGPI